MAQNDQGAWIQAPEIVAAVQVTEANQTISISNIALGENEKLTPNLSGSNKYRIR